jgi:serine/threonine protein kinase
MMPDSALPSDPFAAPGNTGDQPLSAISESEWSFIRCELPGYRLIRQLGSGGQGTVWLAIREQSRDKVALKFSHAAGGAHASLTTRFEQERHTLELLRHPGIVRVIEGGTLPDARCWMATEYISGHSLEDHIRTLTEDAALGKAGAGYPLHAVAKLFIDICTAMHTAHQVGVLHRDLKPSNIIVRHDGQPVIVDFGLARTPASQSGAVTLTGQWLGTPRYASPEQVRGEPGGIDHRSDIYSLGITLYHVITGTFPYNVETGEAELFDNIRYAEPVHPKRHAPQIGRELSAVILQMIAKPPEQRYNSMLDIRDDLQRYLDGEPVHAVGASRWYRARKFVDRHRVLTASISVALILSIGFGLFSFSLYQAQVQATRSAQEARDEAERARNDAEAARNTAEQSLYAYGARGDWQAVLDFADQPQVRGPGNSIEVDLIKLTALEALNHIDQARDFADLLALRYSDSQYANRARFARALLYIGDPDERDLAIEDIHAAIESAALPASDEAYARAMVAGTVDEMIVHLQDTLQLDPFHIRAWNTLVFAQFAAGHMADALDSAMQLSSLYPKDVIGHLYVAVLATLQDRSDLTERALMALEETGEHHVAAIIEPLVDGLRELRDKASGGSLLRDNQASEKLLKLVNEIGARAASFGDDSPLSSRFDAEAVFRRLPPALADSISGIFSGSMKLLFFKNYAGGTRELEAVADVTNEGVTLMLVAAGYIFMSEPTPAIDALQRSLNSTGWIQHHNLAATLLLQVYAWDAITQDGALTPNYEHADAMIAVLKQLDYPTLTRAISSDRLLLILQNANLIGAYQQAKQLIETLRGTNNPEIAAYLDLAEARAELGLEHPISAIRLADSILSKHPDHADALTIRKSAVKMLSESADELLSDQ